MLAIFIKNVVFQYKLAVVLAETRDLQLEKMKEKIVWKMIKILRRTSVSGNIIRNRSKSRSSSISRISNISCSSIISSSSRSNNIVSNNISNNTHSSRSRNIVAMRLAIGLILLTYGRKTRDALGIFKYLGGRQVSRYVRCQKVPIPYVGWKTRFAKFTRMRYIRASRPIT